MVAQQSVSGESLPVPSLTTTLSSPVQAPYDVLTTTIYSFATTVTTTLEPPTASTAGGTAPNGDDSDVSSAVAAGSAVAAAFVAALLTFIITFLIMRRLGQKRQQSKHGLDAEKQAVAGNGAASRSLHKRRQSDLVNPLTAWEKHLPQPADDSSIRMDVRTLLHQVELHVETFYNDLQNPVNVTDELRAELLKVDSPHLPDSIVTMIAQTRHQSVLIKHCLAQLILGHTSADGSQHQSWLPNDFVALPQAFALTRRNTRKPAFSQAFSRWRVLASYLRPETGSDLSYLQIRDTMIDASAETFCRAFHPWANNTRHTYTARKQNLIEIMKGGTSTGIMIFSQPGSFEYRWTMPVEKRRSAVTVLVTPAFAKVADDRAQALQTPQIIVQPVAHPI